VERTGKNLNESGRTEVEIIYWYLPEETEKNHEKMYISLSDTPFKIGSSHHHSAEHYRYSNLFGDSVSLSKTNFSLLEKNTGSGKETEDRIGGTHNPLSDEQRAFPKRG
jgi:hypothetical protein